MRNLIMLYCGWDGHSSLIKISLGGTRSGVVGEISKYLATYIQSTIHPPTRQKCNRQDNTVHEAAAAPHLAVQSIGPNTLICRTRRLLRRLAAIQLSVMGG